MGPHTEPSAIAASISSLVYPSSTMTASVEEPIIPVGSSSAVSFSSNWTGTVGHQRPPLG